MDLKIIVFIMESFYFRRLDKYCGTFLFVLEKGLHPLTRSFQMILHPFPSNFICFGNIADSVLDKGNAFL